MPRAAISKPRGSGTSLAGIQRLLLEAIRRPLTVEEGMQPRWKNGTRTAAVAGRFIKPNDRLDAFSRLQIYNQQYWWRLLGCLRDDFRGLQSVIGEEKFQRLIVAYLDAHPSRSWTLRNLGSRMPEFIERHPHFVKPRLALARDVARVEWARVLAFDEAAQPVIDPAALGAALEQAKAGVQPYVQLLEVNHPVDRFMARLKKRDHQAAANRAAKSLTGRPGRALSCARARHPIFLAVHRVEGALYYKRLTPEAYRLLQNLRSGMTLADACESAFARSKAPPATQARQIQKAFALFAQLGWLCRRTA